MTLNSSKEYGGESDREVLQRELNTLLVRIFRKRPGLSYFQVRRYPVRLIHLREG
jgi:hypothetical protein